MFAVSCAMLTATAGDVAVAENALGFYAGAAVGESQVDTSSGGLAAIGPPDHFRENHSAFKVLAGIRPLSTLGAELAYFDLGHPSGSLGGAPADATMKGTAAFAVLYLPVPLVDVYLKAGAARLQSTINGTVSQACPGGSVPICPPPTVPLRVDRTNTNFAAGGGAQMKFGSLGVRAEYERFTTVGGNPGLVSLGLTWTFLLRRPRACRPTDDAAAGWIGWRAELDAQEMQS